MNSDLQDLERWFFTGVVGKQREDIFARTKSEYSFPEELQCDKKLSTVLCNDMLLNLNQNYYMQSSAIEGRTIIKIKNTPCVDHG